MAGRIHKSQRTVDLKVKGGNVKILKKANFFQQKS